MQNAQTASETSETAPPETSALSVSEQTTQTEAAETAESPDISETAESSAVSGSASSTTEPTEPTETAEPAQSPETSQTSLTEPASTETLTDTSAEPASPSQTQTMTAAAADKSEKIDRPLLVLYNASSRSSSYQGFSPFTGSGELWEFLRSVTCVKLMETDRAGSVVLSGASGESSSYAGKTYDYSGIADTRLEYDEDADKSVYTITLRNDIFFSDGEELTADDVIFTLYTLLDPSYDGTSTLSSYAIEGLTNYLSDSSIADSITEEEIAEAFSDDEVKELIKKDIVIPALTEQYNTVVTLYSDSSYDVYTRTYPRPDELFAFFYSIDSEYKPTTGADSSKVIGDIADMYGGNYRLLGSMTAGDESYYEKAAKRCVIGWLTRRDGGTEGISEISGIKKTGELSLTITADGIDSSLTKAFADTVIAPLHYYGDPELYDPDNSSFGFKKGEASAIASAFLDAPLGAGAYRLTKSENGVIYLSANDGYYKGTPSIRSINISAAPAGASVGLIGGDDGADVMFISGSKECLSEISEINSEQEQIFVGVSSSNGYGYVGLNAQTVNIAASPLSEESVLLRRALATVINAYKAESVREYYGENAKLTDYPVISGTLVGALTEESPVPYTLGIDGEPILSGKMNDEDKKEALKAACLGFLEAAGYTVEEGVVTAAPEGGKTEFTALVYGGGYGAHPCCRALSDASALLSDIGITLNVRDCTDSSAIWDAISSGTHEIWAGAWDDALRVMYLGGRYGVTDERLKEYAYAADRALTPEEFAEACAGCADIMTNEYAVDIPFYKRDRFTAFSSLRIDVSTLPENTTGSYDWTREIEKIEMK